MNLDSFTLGQEEINHSSRIKRKHRPPVLLQVIPALVSGGVERGTIEIARAAQQSGFVSLVASAGGAMEEQLKDTGAHHIYMPLDDKRPFMIFKNFLRLNTMIRLYDVNIIHARSRAPAWSAWLAAMYNNIHFVTTFHGLYSANYKVKRGYNAIMTRGEKVIAVSEHIAEHIRETYRIKDDSRVEVIHRGADVRYFSPKNVSETRIEKIRRSWGTRDKIGSVLFLPGRLTRWKGQAEFIKSLEPLKHLPFYAVIAGDKRKHPQYHKELYDLIIECGLEDKVKIFPTVEDMPAAYMVSDIVISASARPEAFGRVVVEGQAMGKTVVASALGGSKETIIHGRTGYLYDPEEEGSLTRLLSMLIENKESGLFPPKSIREHVKKNFSARLMQQKTLGLYNELIGRDHEAKTIDEKILLMGSIAANTIAASNILNTSYDPTLDLQSLEHLDQLNKTHD